MVSVEELDAQIPEFLEQFLVGLGRELPAYTDDTHLIADLMLDSLDFLALVSELELFWGIVVSDADMSIERFVTIGRIRAFVHAAVMGNDREASAAGL